MKTLPIEIVSFAAPARIGPNMVNGASASAAGGNPCKIEFDSEAAMLVITHLASKRVSLVPLANVSSMLPFIEKATEKATEKR